MIDHEYVKLNTSILSGSNASTPLYDKDGNIKAAIDLRLPDNLFVKNTGARKVDKVEMKTTKFRLSMENTPIAALPQDEEKTTSTLQATKCQLDVYPYCLLDDDQIKPEDISGTVFEYYKDHKVIINIRGQRTYGFLVQNKLDNIDTIELISNSPYGGVSESYEFYDLLKSLNVFEYANHVMNMCLQSNHESYKIENGNYLIPRSCCGGPFGGRWVDEVRGRRWKSRCV